MRRYGSLININPSGPGAVRILILIAAAAVEIGQKIPRELLRKLTRLVNYSREKQD